MGLKKIENGLELKKHINLIHCSNKFSLVQRKLFNALLFNAYPELATKSRFVISSKKLCEMIGYNSNDYKSLKAALLNLITTAIEWNVINESSISKESDKWSASSAISSATLEKGVCTYEYSSVMKELFYQPEIYGRINISLLPKFKSSYGLALYENCVRYQGMPQTPWFKIEIFRKLMGVEEDKYAVFRDFKKRILDVAIKEVNSHSSLIAIPEIKRVGSKVVSIRFILNIKEEKPLLSESIFNVNKDEELMNVLIKEFGLTYEGCKDVFIRYGFDYVNEKVNIIKSSNSFRQGKIVNLAAYLFKGLKINYQDINAKLAQAREEKSKQSFIIESEKNKIEKLHHDYNKYVAEKINNYMLNLPSVEAKKLIALFEDKIKKEFYLIYKWFKKDRLNHPGVKALFNNYIREERGDQIISIMKFDEFKNKQVELLRG